MRTIVKIAVFLALLLAAAAARGQATGQSQITASRIYSGGGYPLASGVVDFYPTTLAGAPIQPQMGGGGVVLYEPAECQIVAGAITHAIVNGVVTSGPCLVADTSMSNQAHFCYKTVVKDTSSSPSKTLPAIPCLQPSGSTWNWDTQYLPAAQPAALVQLGPQGVPGIGSDANCHADGNGNLTCGAVEAGVTNGAINPVQAYNADPDGVRDSTQAIVSACAAAGISQQATVLLQPGTYLHDSQIDCPVMLKANDPGTVNLIATNALLNQPILGWSLGANEQITVTVATSKSTNGNEIIIDGASPVTITGGTLPTCTVGSAAAAAVISHTSTSITYSPLRIVGGWNTAQTYASGAQVSESGSYYTSLQNSNWGNDPASSPTWWQVVTPSCSGSPSGGVIATTVPLSSINVLTSTTGSSSGLANLTITDNMTVPISSFTIAVSGSTATVTVNTASPYFDFIEGGTTHIYMTGMPVWANGGKNGPNKDFAITPVTATQFTYTFTTYTTNVGYSCNTGTGAYCGSVGPRFSLDQSSPVRITANNFSIDHVSVVGGHGQAFQCKGCSNGTVTNSSAKYQSADGFNVAGGGYNLSYSNNYCGYNGDACFSITAYRSNAATVHDITWTGLVADHAGAEGFYIDGGQNITGSALTANTPNGSCLGIYSGWGNGVFNGRSVSGVHISGLVANDCGINNALNSGVTIIADNTTPSNTISDVTIEGSHFTNLHGKGINLFSKASPAGTANPLVSNVKIKDSTFSGDFSGNTQNAYPGTLIAGATDVTMVHDTLSGFDTYAIWATNAITGGGGNSGTLNLINNTFASNNMQGNKPIAVSWENSGFSQINLQYSTVTNGPYTLSYLGQGCVLTARGGTCTPTVTPATVNAWGNTGDEIHVNRGNSPLLARTNSSLTFVPPSKAADSASPQDSGAITQSGQYMDGSGAQQQNSYSTAPTTGTGTAAVTSYNTTYTGNGGVAGRGNWRMNNTFVSLDALNNGCSQFPCFPWTGAPTSIMAAEMPYIRNHFFDTGGITGGAIGSASGQSFQVTNTYASFRHPGQVVLTTGTGGAGTGIVLIPTATASQQETGANATKWFRDFAVYIPVLPTTTAASYYIGSPAFPSIVPWSTNGGIGFNLSSTNAVPADWYCIEGTTTVDSGVAATAATWTRLSVYSDGTNAYYFVGSTAVCNVAQSSLPAGNIVPVAFAAVAQSATSVVMAADYWLADWQITW